MEGFLNWYYHVGYFVEFLAVLTKFAKQKGACKSFPV